MKVHPRDCGLDSQRKLHTSFYSTIFFAVIHVFLTLQLDGLCRVLCIRRCTRWMFFVHVHQIFPMVYSCHSFFNHVSSNILESCIHFVTIFRSDSIGCTTLQYISNDYSINSIPSFHIRSRSRLFFTLPLLLLILLVPCL